MNDNNSHSSEIAENASDTRVFRVRKKHRNQGTFFLIFYILIGIFATYGIWFEEPIEKRLSAAIFFGLFFSFLSFGSLWMILEYKYGSLTIQNGSVIQQGVIFSKEINLSNVKRARWIFGNGGIIKLKSLTSKISIHLDHFERDERLWLIRHFQSTLPGAVQQNWDLFCSKVAIPLRDYDPDEIRTPGPGEILITRKRYDWMCVPFILLFAFGGIIAAWKFQLTHLLIAPVLPTILWLMLRYRTPKQGKVSQRISADKESKQILIFLGWWCSLGIIVFLIFRLTDFPEPQNTIAGYCSMFVWMAIYIVQLNRSSLAIRKRDLEKSKEAVQKWQE